MIYIDDILIAGYDSRGIARLKQFQQHQFHTKDLDQFRYFLGIEVAKALYE